MAHSKLVSSTHYRLYDIHRMHHSLALEDEKELPAKPPGLVEINMDFSVRLMEEMEKDDSIAGRLSGTVVIHDIPGQSGINRYNRILGASIARKHQRDLTVICWHLVDTETRREG